MGRMLWVAVGVAIAYGALGVALVGVHLWEHHTRVANQKAINVARRRSERMQWGPRA